MSEAEKINATGQPDTPMEVINNLLGKSLGATSPEDMKKLVQEAYRISNGLDPYLDRMLSPVPQACQDLLTASAEHDWDAVYADGKTQFKLKREMSAGALEGRVMKMLCAISGAKTVLEVGMFTGTSALAMAEFIPDDGKIVCLELEPYLESFVRPFFEKADQDHKLDIRIGDAVASMQQLADEGRTFDIVFLDANKTGYLSYYNLVMDNNMLTATGFIVVDNALMKGRVYAPPDEPDADSEAIRDFNNIVMRDTRVETVTMPVRDGISIVRLRSPPGTAATTGATAGAAGMPIGGAGNPKTPMGRVVGAEALCMGRSCGTVLGSAGFVSTTCHRLGKTLPVPRAQQRRVWMTAVSRTPQPHKMMW
eukprot:jgi/Ulvmu1/7033/UM033_0092.1